MLLVASILVVGQMYIVMPLYGAMASDFAVTTSAAAWTSTAFGIAYAIGFLFAGPMSDRYGPRRMMVSGLLATAVLTGLVAMAQGLVSATVLRSLQGAAAATFAPAAFSYVAMRVRPGHRVFVLSCVTSSMLASAVLMQLAAQQVVSALGWEAAFAACAPALGIVALGTHFLLRPTPGSGGTSLLSALARMPRLYCQRRLLVLYLATMTLLGSFVGVFTAIAIGGVSNDPHSLLVLRVAGLPAMLAVPFLVAFLQRFSAIDRAAAGFLVAAGAAVMASLFDGQLSHQALALFLLAGALAVSAPALVERIGQAAPAERGAATALYAFSMFLGGSLGGQAVSAFAAGGIAPALMWIGAALLLGFVLVNLSRRL
ncbi:MFS transporter [Noviherbaspirillum aridicola]|uniref:MFS transporter n=1 Tax=Noviherbaspirillum aridicola TaxID=2849687 RepID=A0ABQ4PZT2_9BURK|nr:MFS transporter [Noviherbaspirillum aridicola]